MIYSNLRLSVLLILVALVACQFGNSDLSQIAGEWSAIALTEEEQAVPADLDVVCLDLKSDGTYTFRGTLNYIEYGRFDVDATTLIIVPQAGAKDSLPRSMPYLLFGRDTLQLSMLEEGRPRLLTLMRNVE